MAGLSVVWAVGGTSLNVPAHAGIAWLETVLGLDVDMSPRDRGRLLWARCSLGFYSRWKEGAQDNLFAFAQEGLSIARDHNDDFLLGRFLHSTALALGHSPQAEGIFDEALAASRRAGDTFIIPLLLTSQALIYYYRDPRKARGMAEDALGAARASKHLVAATGSFATIGNTLLLEGRACEALEAFNQSCEMAAAARFAFGVVVGEGFRAQALAATGAWEQALAAAERQEQLGTTTGLGLEAFRLQTRALAAAAHGDHDNAGVLARRALQSPLGSPSTQAGALVDAVRVDLAAGNLDAARVHLDELIGLSEAEGFAHTRLQAGLFDAEIKYQSGDQAAAENITHGLLADTLALPALSTMIEALELLGAIAADAESYQEAARLFGAALALRQTSGFHMALNGRDSRLARVRAGLDPASFDTAYREGQALTPQQAIAYANRGRGARNRPSHGWDSLTPMEAQIVELLIEGKTNVAIGQQLFVSPRTVQSHLTRIYAKLGVRTRTELARKTTQRQSSP